ncbi:helix-turn-helix domain-containing protein [Alteromonadaceae bacterium M269]|nr:helix-turn-helix domain-containing protein [Alteromonadaceae bacterium M269]
MYNVTILGFDLALSSTITGALDLFSMAGVTWQRIQGKSPSPLFNVQLASVDGNPIRCINRVVLHPHLALKDVNHTDLILVPTIGGSIEPVIENNKALIQWLEERHLAGSEIASNCTGAFLLAEAGILDNKQATTHWGFADLFREKYPLVDLHPEQLIVQQENIFCAGGGMAWFDLALLLVERYGGHELAASTAKSHVMDMRHGNQAAYANVKSKKYHKDKDILKVQEWMEQHFDQPMTMHSLAKTFNLVPRTFVRRFKQATQQTPLAYLQNLRVEAAKSLLETESFSPEQVVQKVGYEDLSSFTRLFKKTTSLSLSQYRKKFSRRIQ